MLYAAKSSVLLCVLMGGKELNPRKQKKECGKGGVEPYESPTAQLILPAETGAHCLCTQALQEEGPERSGHACEKKKKNLLSCTLDTYTH